MSINEAAKVRDVDSPVAPAAPLMWTAAALVRGDLGTRRPAAGDAPSAASTATAGSTPVFNFFFGEGTAEHPNGGIILGNGALASGKATMATVNSTVIWTASSDYTPSGTPNYVDLDHELVVIRVDLSTGQVYLNDSGTANGSGMKVPLGAFMNAWQSNDYELTIVSANT